MNAILPPPPRLNQHARMLHVSELPLLSPSARDVASQLKALRTTDALMAMRLFLDGAEFADADVRTTDELDTALAELLRESVCADQAEGSL